MQSFEFWIILLWLFHYESFQRRFENRTPTNDNETDNINNNCFEFDLRVTNNEHFGFYNRFYFN